MEGRHSIQREQSDAEDLGWACSSSCVWQTIMSMRGVEGSRVETSAGMLQVRSEKMKKYRAPARAKPFQHFKKVLP